MSVNPKPARHLINAIKSTRDHHPNFTILLGAGASAESGIKTAGELVDEWRDEYFKIYGSKDAVQDEFLQQQRWYGEPEEYSVLFETLYDQPSLRREVIESLIKDANPSWGYIYLANLVREQIFRTVFTTNFDDLLNEACYLFSTDVRPVVCAHDSSISSIRIFSARPKIVKLHGDFLFDSIKNTVRELENLEENMREKFRQCAGEFGLIVVGYSGNDRTIMDTLDALLRHDGFFPHGVYWCVRNGDRVPDRVEELTRFGNFHVVEISGFDDFFASLHHELGLGLPIKDPYAAIRDRLKSLIESLNVPKPWLESESRLHADIRSVCDKLIEKEQDEFVTNEMRCMIFYKRRKFVDAMRASIKALIAATNHMKAADLLQTAVRCCLESKEKGEFEAILDAVDSCAVLKIRPDVFENLSLNSPLKNSAD